MEYNSVTDGNGSINFFIESLTTVGARGYYTSVHILVAYPTL